MNPFFNPFLNPWLDRDDAMAMMVIDGLGRLLKQIDRINSITGEASDAEALAGIKKLAGIIIFADVISVVILNARTWCRKDRHRKLHA